MNKKVFIVVFRARTAGYLFLVRNRPVSSLSGFAGNR